MFFRNSICNRILILLLISVIILSCFPTACFADKSNGANSVETLDLSDLSPADVLKRIEKMNCNQIGRINFISKDGSCRIDINTLKQVSYLLPETHLECSFDFFGKTISSEDVTIKYDNVNIGNDGLEELKEILPFLTSCTYLLLADCGIDYELLDELRSEYPEKNIVWRVHLSLGHESFLTDETLIRTVYVRDVDADSLKYCSSVKYIDVGHTGTLTDISFVEGMPDLEVLILAKTGVTDLSPLANCKKLEYLELFTIIELNDISPLAGCTNLQHLNIACLPNLTDITCLYELKNLKRLRITTPGSPICTPIPQKQLDTITRLMPNCEMEFGVGDDYCCGWRYMNDNPGIDTYGSWSDRYWVLREQMRY